MITLADVLRSKTKSTKFALPSIEPAVTLDWKKLVDMYGTIGIKLDGIRTDIKAPQTVSYHC